MKRVNFLVLLGVFLLLNVANVSAATIVLKEGGDLDAGGAVGTPFDTLTSADVVQVAVDDTQMRSGNYPTQNYGNSELVSGSSSGGSFALFKFDLSSLGAGAVINSAKFRVLASNGNSAIKLGPVVTQDWNETQATKQSPVGNDNDGFKWGVLADSDWNASNDVGGTSGFNSSPAGNKFLVKDVTALLQSAVDAPASYLGWGVDQGNHGLYMSEYSVNGSRPALFVDYTPGVVPEPASLLLAGMCLGWVAVARKR